MVNKCSVPNCRSNYVGHETKASFSFPKNEELKKRWIHAVRRDNFVPSKWSRVCELHFPEKDIRRTSEIYDEKTGQKVVVNLQRPRLVENVVPTIFPNCPSYLSTPCTSRESVVQKRIRIENKNLESVISQSIESQKEYEKMYMFQNYSEFLVCLSKHEVNKEWTVINKGNVIIFLLISVHETAPKIIASATINQTLEMKLFKNCNELRKFSEETFPKKVNNIKDIFCYLDMLQSQVNSIKQSFDDALLDVIDILKRHNENLDEIQSRKINFFCDQLKLLSTKKERFRYSPEFMIYFSLLYSISPHAYRYLRSTASLNMPHPKTIQKVCSNFNCSPRDEQSDYNFLKYMKQKCSLLQPTDMTVTLMIDEIHIKPYFDYKAGNIVGMSFDSQKAATTAYVFMVHSLLSSFKEVAHILPVNNINGECLNRYIKKVILGLHAIGFSVICVVSDNNAINRKAMSLFNSPPKFSIVYQHPADISKPLFFSFDTVHVLKCIRNNWFNQPDQVLVYPKFEETGDRSCSNIAALSVIKLLYQFESGNLVKYAHTLNMKSLNPSNFERQNVRLVLNIFNEHVHNGILTLGRQHNLQHYESTAEFLEIILKWWNVVNVKTLHKDQRLLNPLMKPLAPNQENYNFLLDCLAWLDKWDSLNCTSNCLTKETHLAFSHSIYALIELTNYCINDLGFKYLLPGKIQTDILEARFSDYRGMAGSQYLVSMRQIFEVESKLRIQSLLPLKLNSKTFGEFTINLADINCNNSNDDSSSTYNVNQNLNFSVSITEEDLLNIQSQIPVLTYIAGYCAHAFLKNISCKTCMNYLVVSDEQVINVNQNCNYDLINNLDRGGLLLPHPDIVNIVIFNYITVQKLISQDNEQHFLNCNNQRQVVIDLTSSKVLNENDTFFTDFYCNVPNHSISNIMYHIIKTATNIFLNNYMKQKNDILCNKPPKKKRKLCTVVK